MVVVRFPDTQPSKDLAEVRKRVVFGLNNYVKEQSYGLASITPEFRGWVTLPDPLAAYAVSPYNFNVDRNRVRKLIENRQPVGFDRVLPDSGILILKVNPDADEGFGTVELVNADPKATHFSRATFKFEELDRNRHVDTRNGIAILPLWKDKDAVSVLITTPGESEAALKAAQGIRKLMARPGNARGSEVATALEEALAAFRKFDFARSHQIVGAIVGDD